MSRSRPGIGVVLLTLFIDIVGFSILFPLVAELMAYYQGQGGGLIASVDALLDRFAPDASVAQRAALFGGVLMGLYSLLQFISAPLWGRLSDRVGRRPVLLLTIGGNLLGYLLWIGADSFTLLLVSRAICGVMAGNLSVATAAVADLTSARERAKGMGLVGMTFGLGFVLGPAIGGGSYILLPQPDGSAEGGFGLHPFLWPAVITAALTACNLLWVWRRFGETLHDRDDDVLNELRPARVTTPFSDALGSGVRRVVLVNLLFISLFAAMEATLVFLAFDAADFGAGAMTGIFVWMGLVSAGIQGGLVRRLAPRIGERRLALVGLLLMVPAFLILGASWGSTMLPAGLVLIAGVSVLSVGIGFAMPSLAALASLMADNEHQGLALGCFRSAGALGRAIGPFLGAGAYFAWSPAAPYWAGAALMLLPVILLVGLRDRGIRTVHRKPVAEATEGSVDAT